MTFTARPVYQGQSNQAIQMEQQTEGNHPTGNKRINSGDMERLKMIKASFYMWQDHKISGIGMGSWEKVITLNIICPMQISIHIMGFLII